jgi:hypothetical protein
MTVSPLSTVGLMLTLASLLGSFFYIHLSQWLRDILALRQKTELNRLQGDETQKRAIVECRVEYCRLASWHTYAVNLVVIGFVHFVLADGLLMLSLASTDPLYGYVLSAFVAFLATFGALSFGLMWLAHANARQIRTMLDELAPRRPTSHAGHRGLASPAQVGSVLGDGRDDSSRPARRRGMTRTTQS